MRIDLYVYLANLDAVLARLDELKTLLLQQGVRTMATMTDLKAQVAATTDAEQAAILVLNDLHTRLIAAQTDPVALQAVIDDLGTSKAALAAAVKDNTPGA